MLILNNVVVHEILIPVVVKFFFIGGVIALALAIGLILRSPKVFRLFNAMNQYISTRHATKAWSTPRDIGAFVWRHSRKIAIFFIVGAVYSIWGLVTGPEDHKVVSALNLSYPAAFVLWVYGSVKYFFIVACLVSIMVGILMLFNPDALKVIENYSARWYSSREVSRKAEKMNMTLDQWVAKNPRIAGLLLAPLGLVTTIHFGSLLFI